MGIVKCMEIDERVYYDSWKNKIIITTKIDRWIYQLADKRFFYLGKL
jgi:hypothetical protein